MQVKTQLSTFMKYFGPLLHANALVGIPVTDAKGNRIGIVKEIDELKDKMVLDLVEPSIMKLENDVLYGVSVRECKGMNDATGKR